MAASAPGAAAAGCDKPMERPGCKKPSDVRATRRDAEEMLGQPLTRREQQIAELVATGMGNKQVAYALRLATGTVKVYLAEIFLKLGVSTRTELARQAWLNKVEADYLEEATLP